MRFGLMGERLVALFLLGLLLFNPPILNLFSTDQVWAGIPVLYIYIYASWLAVIVMAGLTIERTREPDRGPDQPRGDPEG